MLWDQGYDPFRAVAQTGLIANDWLLCLPHLTPHSFVSLHFGLRRTPNISPTLWPLIPSRAWFVVSTGEAQWPCLTVRFPFEHASLWTDLVPLKGLRPPLYSLNQQSPCCHSLLWKDLTGETVHKIPFLSAAVIVHSLGPYSHLNIPSFLPFYHLCCPLLSCHMLIALTIANGE